MSLTNPPGCVKEAFYLVSETREKVGEGMNSGNRWGDNYGVANETDQRGNKFLNWLLERAHAHIEIKSHRYVRCIHTRVCMVTV